MKIGICYGNSARHVWFRLEVPDECTATDAIQRSGILAQFPDIDLDRQKIGVFGKIVKPDHRLKEGDRLEIYRPITADPELLERRDAEETA